MLTSSSSQYLHPDYLQPLPTTLDAKQSPLALLAQTCNSIGKDSNSKSIIPPIEKKDAAKDGKGESPKLDGATSKLSNVDDAENGGGSDKRDSSSANRGDSSKASCRNTSPKDVPSLSQTGSSQNSISPRANNSESASAKSSVEPKSSTTPPASSSSSSGRISLNCTNVDVTHRDTASAGYPKTVPILSTSPSHSSTMGCLKSDSLTSSLGASFPPTLGGYPTGLSLLGHPMSAVDAASTSHLYAASLAAHSGAGLCAASKMAAALPGARGVSPYVSYTSVKTATGATTLVPVCKDPYCTQCQLTLRSAQLSSSCATSCSQCTHDKSLGLTSSSLSNGLAAHHGMLSSTPGVGTMDTSCYPLTSSLYAHAFGVLPGHHGLPYVCNWVSGSEYCGKRFSTSDDLLQHLRTHTSASETSSGLHSALPHVSLGLPLPGLSSHAHYASPASLGHEALRQSYARSLSPNSLLAASRYHPYKPPSLSALAAPPGGALAGTMPSALGAYYSPYSSIYGQRIGV